MNLIRLGLNSGSESLLFFEAAILNNYCDKKRFIIPILHSSMSGELNSTTFSSTPKTFRQIIPLHFPRRIEVEGSWASEALEEGDVQAI